MRATLTFFSTILACAYLNAAEFGLSRQQIEKDLALQVALKSPVTIQVGEQVDVSIVVRNQSRDTAYSLVAPGDGSEAGWREPHVYFTATLDKGNGVSKVVPTARYARCGLFDPAWQKDARTLKPGEELPLKNWLVSPSTMLEFQEPGHVRLVAHYSYRAGIAVKGTKQSVVGLMAGVPVFELVSVPVEFDVVRPLDLMLTVKAPLTVKAKAKISDLFDIRIVNRSKQPVEISSPTISADARLSFEVEGQFGGWRPSIDTQKTTYGEKIALKPNEKIAVLGPGIFANDLDGTWEYPVADTIKVRASFHVSTWRPAPVIQSNWVEIKVIEGKRNAR
jgi:hypothetical protein